MRKTTLVVLTAVIMFGNTFSKQEFIIEAVFTGENNGTYSFIDLNEEEYKFTDIDVKANRKYNLGLDKYIGRTFQVVYEIATEVDTNDEVYEVYYITGLSLLD